MKRFFLNAFLCLIGRKFKLFLVKSLNKFSKIFANSYFSSLDTPYDNGEYKLIETLNTEFQNVIDAGANIGDWSSYFLSKYPNTNKLIIVEPNPLLKEKLENRFSNNLQVSIVNKALSFSKDSSILSFDQNKHSLGMVSMNSSKTFKKNYEIIKTELVTIDSILNDFSLDNIDFLKLDLEGFDYYALLGARKSLEKKKIKFIQFEITQSYDLVSSSSVALFKFLHSFDYNIYFIRPESLEKLDHNNLPDILIYSNFLATYIEI